MRALLVAKRAREHGRGGQAGERDQHRGQASDASRTPPFRLRAPV
jgi:hypothetical protein